VKVYFCDSLEIYKEFTKAGGKAGFLQRINADDETYWDDTRLRRSR